MSPCPHTKQYHKHRLNGMNHKYEIECMLIDHSIKYKHCFHCEMPWSCTIGRRHKHSNAADNKGNEGAHYSKIFRKLKTEESEIIMQEIAHPYTYRQHDIKGQVFHLAQRYHSLPYTMEGSFHLIVYRQAFK